MNYKIKRAIKNNKKYFIIFIIIWILIEVFFVSPIAVSIAAANVGGTFDLNVFIECSISEIATLTSFTKVLRSQVIGYFGKTTLFMTIVYLIAFVIGVSKSRPKNEFTDIEHGSSDWSENGEQYRVLSRNKGIILAENNYLPVDKIGNVNVLIVGRIWFW